MREEKTIKNLGKLNGKLLFLGGVYSNLQSLQALQNWAVQNNYLPDKIFCTGDSPGYCAQPLECIQLIKEWGIHSIAGNVELQLRNNKDDCGCDFTTGGKCDLFSRNWYAYTKSKMNKQSIDWLHTLPHHIQFQHEEKKFTLVHGSWFHTSEFIFKSTPWLVKQHNFDATESDIIIAGHCGLPFADLKENKLWLNAGAIGMPANDGTDRVWFLTLNEEDGGDYKFHHYCYDNNKASKLMRRNGLPPSYADALLTGIWDNCEILPEEETSLQGKTIIF